MYTLKELKENLKLAKETLKGQKRPNKWHLYYISEMKQIIKSIEKVSDMPEAYRESTEPLNEYNKGVVNGLEIMRSTLVGDEPKIL